jgi:uncharacterized Zn finger protein (UPF0148 family)
MVGLGEPYSSGHSNWSSWRDSRNRIISINFYTNMINPIFNNILNQFLEDTKFWATKNMSCKAQEIYDEHKFDSEQEVECPTCGRVKISNPTPDGDEICPDCGDLEMMDKEDRLTDARIVYTEQVKQFNEGILDAYDLSEGEFSPDAQVLKKVEESESLELNK